MALILKTKKLRFTRLDRVDDHYKNVIKLIHKENGGIRVLINRLPQLSRKKSKDWQFQAEYRFHLFALPISQEYADKSKEAFHLGIGLGEIMGHALINNIDPGINYIDVPLNPDRMSEMAVRTGP